MRELLKHQIEKAATFFATTSRDINKIAEACKVSTSSIYNWKRTTIWRKTLESLNYKGPQTFEKQKTRDPKRESGEEVKAAEKMVKELLDIGMPKHAILSEASRRSGVKRQKIVRWSKDYGWLQ